ncbi:hypothetical protein [Dryocola clanedunensis]
MVKATLKMFLCIAALASVSTFAHADGNSGVIHFRGEIVEGGCGLSPQEQRVNITCSNKGKPVTHTVALAGLNAWSVRGDSLMHTNIHYLDPQKRLAIISATYE